MALVVICLFDTWESSIVTMYPGLSWLKHCHCIFCSMACVVFACQSYENPLTGTVFICSRMQWWYYSICMAVLMVHEVILSAYHMKKHSWLQGSHLHWCNDQILIWLDLSVSGHKAISMHKCHTSQYDFLLQNITTHLKRNALSCTNIAEVPQRKKNAVDPLDKIKRMLLVGNPQ